MRKMHFPGRYKGPWVPFGTLAALFVRVFSPKPAFPWDVMFQRQLCHGVYCPILSKGPPFMMCMAQSRHFHGMLYSKGDFTMRCLVQNLFAYLDAFRWGVLSKAWPLSPPGHLWAQGPIVLKMRLLGSF